eukprot:289581-Pleurochrysis_carterae.AAC.1
MPYVGERLGRLIIKFLPASLAGEGRALLRELIDKKISGNESKVIEEPVRLAKMAHSSVPVSAATKGQTGGRSGGDFTFQRQAKRHAAIRRHAVRATQRPMVLERD